MLLWQVNTFEGIIYFAGDGTDANNETQINIAEACISHKEQSKT